MDQRTIRVSGVLMLGLILGVGRVGEGRQAPAPRPERGRYADPYLGIHTWPAASTGNQALFYFVASQRRAAEQARLEGAADTAPGVSQSPSYYRMRPGGSTTGSYFGRTVVVRPNSGPPRPSRYNRFGHYFGNLGR